MVEEILSGGRTQDQERIWGFHCCLLFIWYFLIYLVMWPSCFSLADNVVMLLFLGISPLSYGIASENDEIPMVIASSSLILDSMLLFMDTLHHRNSLIYYIWILHMTRMHQTGRDSLCKWGFPYIIYYYWTICSSHNALQWTSYTNFGLCAHTTMHCKWGSLFAI